MKKFFTGLLMALTLAVSSFSATAQSIGKVAPPARAASDIGHGYYVNSGKVYKPDGTEMRLRGFNVVHYDSTHTGMELMGGNAFRINLYLGSKTPEYNLNLVKTDMAKGKGMVGIPSNWGGTCKAEASYLQTITDVWVAQASTWTQLNDTMILNIANEWGPPNSTVWRDSYITSIQRLRAAGYTGLLMVDSGGCGQDAYDIINYGPAVLAADPLHNILFDVHVYGGFSFPATVAWQVDYTKAMAALKATGLPIVLGEFGPGNSVGPSPTKLTPTQVVETAEANEWGWLGWAYDDNNLPSCGADDNWFSFRVNTCRNYTGADAELTTFGKTMRGLLAKYNTPPPPPVVVVDNSPVLDSFPTLWCRPNYSCSMYLAAHSPLGSKVSFKMENATNSNLSLSTGGLFGWWSGPKIGEYDFDLVLSDTFGNVKRTPIHFIVSWCTGKVC